MVASEVASSRGASAFADRVAGAAGQPRPQALLEIENLHVQFVTSHGTVRAVEGLSYSVRPGEMVAIVGESGSGKSVSALAVMQLLPAATGRITGGSVRFDGKELLTLSEEEMRRVRGREIAMIFQEPMTSLNPVLKIGLQIMEPLKIHLGMDDQTARARAVELLTLVGITDPESRLKQYPHQLSGGMRQRVMIAIGLSCNPKLLLADEPTTALDVTIQAQILELMKDLSRRLGVAVVVITHNLGIVARYADRVNVMYAARLAESGTAERVFGRPLHPYSRGLLSAVPRLDRGRSAKLATIDGAPPNLLAPPEGCRFHPRCRFATDRCHTDPPFEAAEPGHLVACHRVSEIEALDGRPPGTVHAAVAAARPAVDGVAERLLDVKDASKFFPVRMGFLRRPWQIRAVNEVTLDIKRGETLGLVGESGCGKSTLGRLVLRLDDPTAGEISLRRRRPRPPEGRRAARRAQAHAGDLPGSVLLAQPAHDRRPDHRRAHAGAPHPAAGRDFGPRGGAAADGRAVPLHGAALPARAVRRPAPARRHRQGAVGEPAHDRLRRGGLGARRVDPGPGDQPAGGPAAEAGAHLPLHRPRPGRGARTSRPGWP